MNDKQAFEKVIKEQGSSVLSEKGNVYTNYEGSIYSCNLNGKRKEVNYIGEVYKGEVFTKGNYEKNFYKLDEKAKTINSISEEVFRNIYIAIIRELNREVSIPNEEKIDTKYRDYAESILSHVTYNLSRIIYNRIKYGEYFIKEYNKYANIVYDAIERKHLSHAEIVHLYIDENYEEFAKNMSSRFSPQIIEQNRAIQKVIKEKNIEQHMDKFTRIYEYHEALMKLDMDASISVQYKVSGAIDIIDSIIKESVINRLKGKCNNDTIEHFKEWKNQIRKNGCCEIEFKVSDLRLEEDSIGILSKAICQKFFTLQSCNIYFKAVRYFEDMSNVISIEHLGEDIIIKDMFS